VNVVDLIRKKRDGVELTTAEIRFLVDGVCSGQIPDYQLAAFLMAACCRGLGRRETMELTLAMAESGEQVRPGAIPPPVVDKHSTGGVGDKVTLVVVPLLAAAGVRVAKLSGRGLGHTGGTVDKLQSIPGLRTDLSLGEFVQQVRRIGAAIAAASTELVPADARLYALRDVTATVDSLPLIASSVMAKKLAGGADVIVLDVKHGRGALVQEVEDARRLAELMLEIGTRAGRRMAAILSSMDQPLGRAVGNANEVEEAIACLKGGGPPDLEDVAMQIAAVALCLGKEARSVEEARDRLRGVLRSGRAAEKLGALVRAQGGPVDFLEVPQRYLPKAPVRGQLRASRAGYVDAVDALQVGEVACGLGAGRRLRGQPVDLGVGLELHAKIGDRVVPGQPLATVHARSAADLESALTALSCAFGYRNSPVQPPRVLTATLLAGDP